MRLRNSITIIGRLGQDPDYRTLQSGAEVCKFSLATSEKYKNRAGELIEETQWHTVIAWRKLAEIVNKLAQKGDEVAVRGKMTYRKWEDKNGNPRTSAEVVAEEFLMLSSKTEKAQPATKQEPATTPENSYAEKSNDDDIPF